jgi:hypothetical protein
LRTDPPYIQKTNRFLYIRKPEKKSGCGYGLGWDAIRQHLKLVVGKPEVRIGRPVEQDVNPQKAEEFVLRSFDMNNKTFAVYGVTDSRPSANVDLSRV